MKLKENLLKKEKGITLVALVITIIVLLILSAVAVASLKGRNNIIDKAQDAKTEYSQASTNEEGTLSEYEKELAKYGNGGQSSKWNLTGTYASPSNSYITYKVYKRNNNTEVKIVTCRNDEQINEYIPTLETEPNLNYYTPDGIEYSAAEIEADSLSWWCFAGTSGEICGESKDGSTL